MIEIELNHIIKNYGLKNILDDFHLEVKTGERIALIGQNGSGKSTVLKIIAKQEVADSGAIHIRKGAAIGLLHQIYENEKQDVLVKDFLLDSFQELLEMENRLRILESKMAEEQSDHLQQWMKEYGKWQEIFQMKGGYEIQEKYQKICSKFGLNSTIQEMKYNHLSGGEKTKVNLARLLLKEPDILLLDEPTNHLDMESLEFLEDFILHYPGTVLVVSHDRYFLDQVATKTVLLEKGKAKIYLGNYSYFLKEDERRTLEEFEKYKSQQKQIEKMKESIATLRKFGDLAGNEMFFKRAKSIEKRLEKMEVLDKVSLEKQSMNFDFNMEKRSGKDVVRIEHLSKQFQDKTIFDHVSITLSYGEKVALIGKNGSGKSTLIKMMLGEDQDYDGMIEIGPSVKIGYIPQNIIFPNETQTVLDYFMENNSFSETTARNKLAGYGFRKEEVFKKIGKLSGGEKVRIRLMKLIQKDINFLVLDEPTNHIDINTREILEEALKEFRGTILFVSHDRYFVNQLATQIWGIQDHQIQSHYGNYHDFKR